jgi:DUF177 domain-containing protein
MLFDFTKMGGPREHVQRTLEASAVDPHEQDYRIAEPVELSMDVEKAGRHTFRVAGRATTTLELVCSRCLEPFTVPVDVDFDLRYVPQSENVGVAEREIAEDDLSTAYYREGLLDVTELLREQFQLALPMKPLCTEACRGLCAECGANLNQTDCGHASKWEDPRLAPLKTLMNRPKES